MTATPVAPRRAAPTPPLTTSTDPDDPTRSSDRAELRQRGRLTIAERAIEKVAGQATAEISTARGRSGGLLGIGAEPDTHARPKVDVDLSTDSVDLAVAVGIAYPGSIRSTTQQIRDHVTAQVQGMTGVRVHRIDIDVTFLTTNGGARSSTLDEPGTDRPSPSQQRKELR